MAATDQLFGWRKNSKKLKADIIQILQSHSPRYGDVQVILPKSKMATTSRLFKYL